MLQMGWWYVHRASGENVGPLNEAGVVAELDSGRLMPNGWVCQPGAAEWVLVSTQREFALAAEHALKVLGEAPTAYRQNEHQQRQLAALYESSIEGPSTINPLPPSKRPTDPPPPAQTAPMTQQSAIAQPRFREQQGMAPRPAPTLSMEPQPSGPPGVPAADTAVVPANPLTEPFGVVGWLAVALTALTSFAYLIDAVVLVVFSPSWVVLVALLASAVFAWAVVQLMRRRAMGFRLAFGGHGTLVGLVLLGTIIRVGASGRLDLIMIVPAGVIALHAVALIFLQLARSLFWIRD